MLSLLTQFVLSLSVSRCNVLVCRPEGKYTFKELVALLCVEFYRNFYDKQDADWLLQFERSDKAILSLLWHFSAKNNDRFN